MDTKGIGFKLSVTEVVMSNFEETAKKFVSIVTVGFHFKLGISFRSILSFDCLPKNWYSGSFDMTLSAGGTCLTPETSTIFTLPFESTTST